MYDVHSTCSLVRSRQQATRETARAHSARVPVYVIRMHINIVRRRLLFVKVRDTLSLTGNHTRTHTHADQHMV